VADTKTESSAESISEKLHDRFRDGSDRIRQRADLTAKTLGGLGTTVLTALGIAKLGDVFPVPQGPPIMAALALPLSFLVMAAVVGFFTYRLWRLNEPIVLASDVELMEDLRNGESERVQKIYLRAATLNRAPSLAAYEARAHQLERIAQRSDDAAAKRYRAMAHEIEYDVLETEAKAALVVIRGRASKSVGDIWALLAYAIFVLGVVAFALSAAELNAVHSGEIAIAKNCADVAKAGATQLPTVCRDYVTLPATHASAKQEADSALKSLTDAFYLCRRAAESSGTGERDCQAIRSAIVALASG